VIRLFAGLSLPGEVRSALSSWAARSVGREEAVRLLPAESLHVTLVFLGGQEESHVEAISAAVVSAARPLPPLTVTGAAWLPPRRPGVLVADLSLPDELTALHRELVAALAPWHEPDTRPYRPHVTVGRVRRQQRISARDVLEPPALEFSAPELVLWRSLAEPGGSRYDPLASAPVSSPGR
jgi:2'-5' RNA ligase